MLVLTRKSQESVVISGTNHSPRIFKVKVLEIQSDRVKLGFDVDPDVPVHRLEVWERFCGNDPNGTMDAPPISSNLMPNFDLATGYPLRIAAGAVNGGHV